MKSLFTLMILTAFISLNAQQGNTIITKATATWCPSCGSWGWDYLEALKEEFPSGPVVMVSAHKGDSDLQSDASKWYTDNLKVSGQPRFYFNSELNSVSGSSWNDKLAENVNLLKELSANSPSLIQFDRYSINSGYISNQVYVGDLPQSGNTYSLATYVLENNVVYDQSGFGNDAIHTNIMRSSLGDPAGIPVESNSTVEFGQQMDPDWNASELGLLTVLYEIVGDDYIIVNSTYTPSALLADNEELLDPALFSYSDQGNALILTVADDNEYQLSLTDMAGRTVLNKEFENSISIDKTELISGMYVVTLRTGNSVLSQQIFIN